jgi:hypothetical protein
MRNGLMVAAAAMLMALAPLSFGQAISGDVIGTVLDATGATIPNVTVTAENQQTGVKTTAKTNPLGEYRISNLLVGTYSLTASAPGFAVASLKNLGVELNKTITANLTLQVGTTTTTVEVSEASAAIDTTTAQVQSTFSGVQATQLPMTGAGTPGTNFGVYNLSLLSAGVSSSGGVGVGIGPSVGGQRPRNNNFTVEGTDNNRKDITGPTVYVPNEATAEFTLLQNQFSPEYGHSSGGQFNLIIKSGENSLHGSLYEYNQNRNYNAVDQLLANQGTYSNPRYDQNRVGGSLGGPLVKNKLFAYGLYEYNPLGQSSVPPGVFGPTAAGFAALNKIPGLYQTNVDILNKYVPVAPAAKGSPTIVCPNGQVTCTNGVSIPIGPLPLASPNFTNGYNMVFSMDYTASEKDQWRGRYVSNRINSIDTNANLPVFYSIEPIRQYLVTIAEYHNFSPSVVNEFRFGYNRFNQSIPVPTPPYPGLDTFPNVMIDNDLGIQIGPDPNGPQFTILNTYQLSDNISWNKGKHQIKIGFDGRKLIAPQQFTQRKRGDYDYSILNQFVNDLAPDDLSERSIDATPYYGDQIASYLFANDNWRLNPHLTVNLGVRYEYTTVPNGERLQSLNHISDVPGVLVFNTPKPQRKNFAPRLGLAYSPGNSGNTSIRAGFGMAYDVLFDNIGTLSKPPQFSTTIDTDLNSNSPHFLQQGGILPAYSVPTTPTEARAATANYITDQVLPYSIQWNFGIQHIFMKDYTFEARYLGSRGVHLDTQTRLNRISAVTPTRQLPTYLQAPSQAQLDSLQLTLNDLQAIPTNIWAPYGFPNNIVAFPGRGNSTYHGLALQLNRRFSAGLQFVGSYTWSHLIDDSTADFFSTFLSPRRPQDFQDLKAEKATSALDRRHRFSFSTVWDLPMFRHSGNWMAKNLIGNWLYTGTYTFESPEYATVQSGRDSNLNGDSAGDRAVVNAAGDPTKGTDVTALKNTAGKIVGYLANDPSARYIRAGLGSFGNAGRNTLPTNHINNFDMSVMKKFSATERFKVEFGAGAYNVFNHAQFVPGQLNNINLTSQITTRNFLIPGTRDFNNFSSVWSSNPRTVTLIGRFTF